MSGKNNTGALFLNERRGDNAKAPKYKGSCMIDGAEYWISGWVRHSTTREDRQQYLSLAFETKEAARARNASSRGRQAEEPRTANPAKSQKDLDDDIPF